MRKFATKLILTIIATGAITNGVAAWRELAVVEQRVETLEKGAISRDDKIDDIHWYLIESKGIKINRRDK